MYRSETNLLHSTERDLLNVCIGRLVMWHLSTSLVIAYRPTSVVHSISAIQNFKIACAIPFFQDAFDRTRYEF